MVIVLSGSRRFVLVVEVVETAMVMSGAELTGLVGREGDWVLTDTLGENPTDQKRLRPACDFWLAPCWEVVGCCAVGPSFRVDVALEAGSARFHVVSVGIGESGRVCNG